MIAQLRLKYARSLELISSIEAEHSEAQKLLEHEIGTKTNLVDSLSSEVSDLKDQLNKALSDSEESRNKFQVCQLTLDKSKEENKELLIKMKELESSLSDTCKIHEETKSSQLNFDSELIELRKQLIENNKEIYNLKKENENLINNKIQNDELESLKIIENNLRNDLEQCNLELEDVLRQLAVERHARAEAERIRNETGEQLALCASRLRNLNANHEELQNSYEVAVSKTCEITSQLVVSISHTMIIYLFLFLFLLCFLYLHLSP
mmetsp:Transcript_49666/g.63652  ORF Transcript_49666/g.63652 Transcript_49666/m.63652 type:complete len:265 (+) Transcript_49666:75-869(+)